MTDAYEEINRILRRQAESVEDRVRNPRMPTLQEAREQEWNQRLAALELAIKDLHAEVAKLHRLVQGKETP